MDHSLSPSAEAWCLKEPITHWDLWAPLSALSGSCTALCEIISRLTNIYKSIWVRCGRMALTQREGILVFKELIVLFGLLNTKVLSGAGFS